MASSSKKDRRLGLVTAKYIDTLRSLCTFTKASAKDISGIFNEFNRTLGRGASRQSTSSRGARRGRGDSALQSGSGDRENFDQPCTCEPGEKQCWLVSELEEWNRVLSRNYIELHEHSWGELVLLGFKCPENNEPGTRDVLMSSLLINVLLRQHRCVTDVVMDHAITKIEMGIFWHSLQNGATGVRSFSFTSSVSAELKLLPWMSVGMWSQSAVCLPSLRDLHVSRVLFDAEAAETLGDYLVRTTTLKYIRFQDVQAGEGNATVFLDSLAQNQTVTSLLLPEHFVMAQEGQALARVVQNHVALERLQICGTHDYSPSAVLLAAVQSRTLKWLCVRMYTIHAEDIEVMAAALTRHPPSYASLTGTAAKAPPTRTSRLESLGFYDCNMSEPRLQVACAALIGGVLLKLMISRCPLGEEFASTAACKLRTDSRLRVLNLKESTLPVHSICILVQALEVNSTLERFGFDLHRSLPESGLCTMFNTIRELDVSSRIHVNWYNPRPLDYSQGGQLCSSSGLFAELDMCRPEDVATLLEPLASGRNVISACIQCAKPVEDAVVQQLVDALGKTKSLRELDLVLNWSETSIVNVLRSLEQNRSVWRLHIGIETFKKRSARALARLVEENRTLSSLFVDLDETSDGFRQHLTVCRELKEAVSRNRFLTSVSVNLEDVNRASDSIIKEALRRNRVLVNEAVRFVKGSNNKKHALAFESLQNSWAVLKDLNPHGDVRDEARAKVQIREARRRLALNYFVFTGVVKAKIACHPHPKKRARFSKLSKDVQAYICSYLSLTDVIDI